MKVKLKTIYAGPSRVAQPGDVIDVHGDEAKALFEGGFAEPVQEIVETATAEPKETADIKRRRK